MMISPRIYVFQSLGTYLTTMNISASFWYRWWLFKRCVRRFQHFNKEWRTIFRLDNMETINLSLDSKFNKSYICSILDYYLLGNLHPHKLLQHSPLEAEEGISSNGRLERRIKQSTCDSRIQNTAIMHTNSYKCSSKKLHQL